MKTILIILLTFTIGSFANAQLVRKRITLPVAVNANTVSNKKICSKPVQNRKSLHIQKTPVRFERHNVKALPLERKEK